MAEEVEMTPVAAEEPPKANPLAKPVAPKIATLKLNPVVRKPVIGGTQTAALKPGLKLPPKPTLGAGVKLPPKPATVTAALKPGLKLPTQNALKPGIKLPPKPVIRKPGATVTAVPLPKPLPKPVTPAAPAAAPAADVKAEVPAAEVKPVAPIAPAATVAEVKPVVVEAPKPVAPVAEVKSVAAVEPPKPVAVDAQGVGKLPTVEAKAVSRDDTAPVVSENPKPMEALKSVTQKLKGVTQEIPQQAILRKTGIIADAAMSEAQKEAAKHKTARISLSDAMGVAPVKNENAPMKTIKIKRPIGIPGATGTHSPLPKPVEAPAPAEASSEAVPAEAAATSVETKPAAASTMTQRKTLKIARPGGGAVRPSGKFGIKRPSQASTVAKPAATDGDPAVADLSAAPAEAPVQDIADIPDMPMAPVAAVSAPASDGPAWLWALSAAVQLAACVAVGALALFLYQNTQTAYF